VGKLGNIDRKQYVSATIFPICAGLNAAFITNSLWIISRVLFYRVPILQISGDKFVLVVAILTSDFKKLYCITTRFHFLYQVATISRVVGYIAVTARWRYLLLLLVMESVL
jgi:hypothetical protein